MFTGIIQAKGEVESIQVQGEKARIRIKAGPLAGQVKRGDSISVSGVCLTAVLTRSGSIEFDVVTTTLNRSRLKSLGRGHKVNLEPALRLSDPLGGHLVSGHVDGVGRIRALDKKPGEWRFRIDALKEVMDFLVERGSVAVDGISLTVARLLPDGFEVAVIPTTWEETTLGEARVGDLVNLEGDMIGRWVAKYMDKIGGKNPSMLDKLRDEGFLE